MKTSSLLLALVVSANALLAADAPQLVPRPIPGLPAPAEGAETATTTSAAPAPLAPVVPQASALMTNPDRARVVYIHRRATLPAELTKDLPVNKATASAPATMLNMRPGAVKIIPKAQVAQILTSKP
ncbi:hypothetical protein [Brevifollis gellanilyticus]|uniref:Uncharacterized protein n=1 Tax=Brevifollis gellanilyticus TaxID=748831 RepID=A0A512M6F9_9BACT|nr:hypothetical protein [Brevifollis gellanilyticus]GEP42320.1 hypothetical protein BGE01nite_16110 [Brevifollis gellanilyticus]